ncbi:MAG: hypothetical protein JJU18_09040 [Oceanicaulis sp.]|nr:hypothetical protein [Oceanicaulis sp.]
MQPMNLTQVANTLAEHPTRIQNWITRGQFQPPMFSQHSGKREWTPNEVLRLAVFAKLVNEFGISASVAGGMTLCPMAASENENFFVAWRAHDDAVQSFNVDSVKRENIGRFLRGEIYTSEGQEPKWIDPQLNPAGSIVIDPAPIVRALRAEWEAEGLDWE